MTVSTTLFAAAVAASSLTGVAVADAPIAPVQQVTQTEQVSTQNVVQPRASIGGVSANATKANWTNDDIINIAIINHNSHEVKLVTQLQHLNGSNWENRRTAETSWWIEYQSAGLGIMPIVTDGTYRYQVKVYHGVTGALMGTMNTSNFYVK